MSESKLRISIPSSYEFSSLDEALQVLGGEDVVLEVVKRYFDYASANRKYRLSAAEQRKQLSSALAAKGISVKDLLTQLASGE